MADRRKTKRPVIASFVALALPGLLETSENWNSG